MAENNKFELSDEELDNVVGCVSVGDREKVNACMVGIASAAVSLHPL